MNQSLAIELLKSDLPIKEIAKKSGYSAQGIYQIAWRKGYCTKRKEKEVKELQAKVAAHREKHTTKETAELFGVTEDYVRTAVRLLTNTEHPCLVCGTITKRPKYCSEDCNRKARNVRSRAYRRARTKSIDIQMVNPEITLDEVYQRDNGVCYLCGEKCDKEDYVWKRKGLKICGGNYPSIDHIKPISLGGPHSWDNVRLAHMSCNSSKGGNYGTE